VYLVDDDVRERTELKRALVGHGHPVWDTGDAREAIRQFAAAAPPDQPDVVISGTIMPEMPGERMVDVLAAISPGIRVIYLTDPAEQRLASATAGGSVVATLRRPVSVDTLLEALDDAGGR
jgi:CheY-like chemotaxis protein